MNSLKQIKRALLSPFQSVTPTPKNSSTPLISSVSACPSANVILAHIVQSPSLAVSISNSTSSPTRPTSTAAPFVPNALSIATPSTAISPGNTNSTLESSTASALNRSLVCPTRSQLPTTALFVTAPSSTAKKPYNTLETSTTTPSTHDVILVPIAHAPSIVSDHSADTFASSITWANQICLASNLSNAPNVRVHLRKKEISTSIYGSISPSHSNPTPVPSVPKHLQEKPTATTTSAPTIPYEPDDSCVTNATTVPTDATTWIDMSPTNIALSPLKPSLRKRSRSPSHGESPYQFHKDHPSSRNQSMNKVV